MAKRRKNWMKNNRQVIVSLSGARKGPSDRVLQIKASCANISPHRQQIAIEVEADVAIRKCVKFDCDSDRGAYKYQKESRGLCADQPATKNAGLNDGIGTFSLITIGF